MSGIEVLVICGIIGGVIGYFSKKGLNSKPVYVRIIVGVVAACFITWLLTTYVAQSILLMPLYGALGAWLGMTILKKV
jgi:hypothetical protein